MTLMFRKEEEVSGPQYDINVLRRRPLGLRRPL